MIADAGRRALRRSAALLDPSHVALVDVRGDGAFAALDRLLPCDLHLADGQARPTLLLDDDGSVVADATVARLEKRYLLFVDGCSAEDVIARLRSVATAPVDARDGREEASLVSLHGPYAWELAGAWLGKSVAGIPPLALLRGPDFIVLRGGRTGEYGYEVLVSGTNRGSVIDRLREHGARFDLADVSLDAFDACVLEAGGFVRRWIEGRALSPFELQLQWRVARKKEHPARAALERRRTSASSRIVWWNAPGSVAPSGPIALEGEPVGVTLAAKPAATGDCFFGVALLDRAVSHPGFQFTCDGGVRVDTVSPPLVVATSVRVRPQTDSYATRDRSDEDAP